MFKEAKCEGEDDKLALLLDNESAQGCLVILSEALTGSGMPKYKDSFNTLRNALAHNGNDADPEKVKQDIRALPNIIEAAKEQMEQLGKSKGEGPGFY